MYDRCFFLRYKGKFSWKLKIKRQRKNDLSINIDFQKKKKWWDEILMEHSLFDALNQHVEKKFSTVFLSCTLFRIIIIIWLRPSINFSINLLANYKKLFTIFFSLFTCSGRVARPYYTLQLHSGYIYIYSVAQTIQIIYTFVRNAILKHIETIQCMKLVCVRIYRGTAAAVYNLFLLFYLVFEA